MSDNSFGRSLVMVSFGESHGEAVGVLIEGIPAGTVIEEKRINEWLARRKPNSSVASTKRKEEDTVEILSGVYRGRATGAPFVAIVRNKGSVDEFYEFSEEGWVRPGHADYPAYIKYKGFNDPRGGGRFSARITVGFVIAGAIAEKMLEPLNVEVIGYTKSIGPVECPDLELDTARKRYDYETRCPSSEHDTLMKEEILKAKKDGDSLGGTVRIMTGKLPVGLGQPVFSSIDSELAKAYFSIPAVKGVEIGAGFAASKLRGSQNNDAYTIKNGEITTLTNNAGGILGGMTNGQPLIATIAFKPVSSIYRPQRTVNVKEMKEGTLQLKGLHDACVVPRAVPIAEALTYFVLADMALRGGFISER
ncbi:MAG: chorismate synthase [Nitrososphaeria archaeon]